MISKQQISKFESDGYIHIPNFFDENEIKIFSKAINIKKSLIEKYSIDKTVDIEEVWEFINNTKMLSIIRSLLGDKIYYMHDASIISGSTKNSSNNTWHRDNPCRRTAVGPDWNIEEKYNVVSSAVYLTDSNSTLNVIKKSHFKSHKYSISNMLRVIQRKLRNKKKLNFLKTIIESLIGKHIKYGAGDLVIFYTTLLHTGSVTKNSENDSRDTIIARYGGEGSHMKTFLNYEMNYRKGIEKYEISTKKNIFFQKLKDNDIYISPEIVKEKINGIFIPKNQDSDSVYKK
tara:strand:- start:148 stop:1011 length:864 start_codon:yes stop_codon:yes gene_type:complete